MAGYLCPMLNSIIFANCPYLMHFALFCWQSLSDASGIIFLQSGSPNIIPICNVLLLLGTTNVWYDTSGFQIRLNGILSKKIRILTPKNGGCSSRKSTSVEKTAVFEVFCKVLIDKWLHGYLSVNGRFTKYEFAKGKVSSCERPCFIARNISFDAVKAYLSRCETLAMRK